MKSAASSAEVSGGCAPEACGRTKAYKVAWAAPFISFSFTSSTHPARSFISFSLPAPTPPVRSFLFHFQQPPRLFVRFFFTSRREVKGRRWPALAASYRSAYASADLAANSHLFATFYCSVSTFSSSVLGWASLVSSSSDSSSSSTSGCESRTDYRVLATRRKTHTAKSASGPAKATR